MTSCQGRPALEAAWPGARPGDVAREGVTVREGVAVLEGVVVLGTEVLRGGDGQLPPGGDAARSLGGDAGGRLGAEGTATTRGGFWRQRGSIRGVPGLGGGDRATPLLATLPRIGDQAPLVAGGAPGASLELLAM